MQARSIAAGLIAALAFSAFGSARAQGSSSDVTFEVPLNLTRLHPAITSLKVSCTISSMGINRLSTGTGGTPSRTAETVVAITGGNAVQTVQVVIPLTDQDFDNNASGKAANYSCKLLLQEPNGRSGWVEFRHAQPQYTLTPLPPTLSGSFVW